MAAHRPLLEEAELLTTIDRAVLVRYCCAWADWVELQGLVQQSGKVLKGAPGHLVRNPLWFQLQDAGATVSELGKQLGLSPVARIRAGVPPRYRRTPTRTRHAAEKSSRNTAAPSAPERTVMTTNTPPTYEIEQVAIDDLRPDPANPRRISDHQLGALTKSLRKHGFVEPVLARREDRTVIGGHQRLTAARRLGYKTVPVTFLDISLEEARLLNSP